MAVAVVGPAFVYPGAQRGVRRDEAAIDLNQSDP